MKPLDSLEELETTDFDNPDSKWTELIGSVPQTLPISIKEVCFHEVNTRGNATAVIDKRIYTYIIKTHDIFVCGGIPYIYEDGYYKMDLRGTRIKPLIEACCLEKFAKSTTTDRIYKMFLQHSEIERRPEELNHHSGHYINFKNGMYDVIRKKLYPHSPKILSVNQIPWEYDPKADHGSGVEIEKFLKFAVPDKSDREMLLEYIGLCCSIDTSQQKMLVICGDGGTGKSTIINLIQKLVGKPNISNVSMSKLQDNFQAIRMMGKLLNSCADLEIDALDDVTMIKKLIGEDSISDSYKGKDIISFDNYAKLLFSTNELPLVRNEKTEGFYRRLLILAMNEKPEHRDPELPKRLEAELPYLLHIAMEALHRMYKRGYILVSENSTSMANQLRMDSDTVESFIDECCVRCGEDTKTHRNELYDNYEKYCEEWGRQAHQRRSFFKALRNKGFKETKSGNDRMFKGIRMRLESDNDDDFVEISQAEIESIPFH